jgi:hypothetical protein
MREFEPVKRRERGLPRNLAGRGKLRLMKLLAPLLCAISAWLICPPANAQYEPPKQMTVSPTGVDLTRGHFTYKALDFSIGPFTLERSYIGHNITGSEFFGRGWSHNYSVYAYDGDSSHLDSTLVVIGRASVHFTQYGSTYSCWNPDCEGASLQLVGGAFVYSDKMGNVYTFNASVNAYPPIQGWRNQRVARIDYADGHTLLYTYNAGGQLTQISSNRGYALVFEYQGNGWVSRACGYNRAVTYVTAATTCAGAALSASYGYANGVNLTSVVDVTGQTWGYDYAGASVWQLTCVRQVNSSSCLIANNFAPPAPWNLQQTLADGSVLNYWFVRPDPSRDDPQLPGDPPPHSEGNYQGPNGLEVDATFGGGLLDSYTENGRATYLTYNGIELETLTYPEGNSVYYGRDARQNVTVETWTPKPNSNLNPVSRTTTYPDSGAGDCTSVPRRICNLPIARTDYNHNETDYSYDPAHGGVLTETGPAPTPGAPRPQTRHEYVQRYAWVANGSGGYTLAGGPLWVQTATSLCRTSAATGNPAAPCATAGDEVRTAYDYGPDSGPNTLLLRGQTVTSTDNGVTTTLRICYSYDWQGHRISQTQPNANLASCP